MTHKICLSAAALLALLLALPAPALAYRLSAGLSHTAYVDEHGTLWTWGSNQEGQLGAETQETGVDREGNQVAVSGTSLAVLEDVRSVAAGGDFTVALKTDGTLWAWGGNDYGQRGNGTVVSAAQPVQVLDQVTAVSAGDYHVAAIRADGTLWTWGDNLYGQLGDGTRDSVSAPHQVLADVRFAVMGDYHAAAISTDGTLYTWGSNLDGQLGNGGLGDTTDEEAGAMLQQRNRRGGAYRRHSLGRHPLDLGPQRRHAAGPDRGRSAGVGAGAGRGAGPRPGCERRDGPDRLPSDRRGSAGLGISRHGPAGQRYASGEGRRAGRADGGRRGGARGHPLSEGHGSGAAGAFGGIRDCAGRCRCGDAAALSGASERGAGCEADKGSSLAQFRSKFPPLSLLTNPRQSAILYAVKNLIPSCDEGNMPPWISHAESGRSVQGRGEWGGVSPRSVRYLSGRCWTPIRVVPRRNLWSSSL